jgi:GntR family transcriptional regulator
VPASADTTNAVGVQAREEGAQPVERRRSLADSAEEALANWLAPGRYRPGDRLPPEHNLASMLGVSRGTLRTALQRLEESGEIVRRQGSGTFVGSARPTALNEGLERLESYSSLARRRGLTLSQRTIRMEHAPIGPDLAAVFEIAPGTLAPTFSRIVLINARPNAIMHDVVHPDVELPGAGALADAFERGDMLLDVLVGEGLPITFSATRILPVLIGPHDTDGKALEVRRTVAGLELQETVHVATRHVVQRSRDVFLPGGVDLEVIRSLHVDRPVNVGSAISDADGRR